MAFNPLFSTLECYRGTDTTKCLEDDLTSLENHTHDTQYVPKALQAVSDDGVCQYNITVASGQNCLSVIEQMPIGMHTIYSQSGVSGNPKSIEAWRMLTHKTGNIITWVLAFGSMGSVFTNYRESNGWVGWSCLIDGAPQSLWTGQYYLAANQIVTPTKSLSECQHGWMLLWSDYDPATSTANNSDFVATYIPKVAPNGENWNGSSFLLDIPRYASSEQSSEDRIVKRVYVHDTKLVGHADNSQPNRNDVVLRAVYEF